MAQFTVLKSNELIGTSKFVGPFDDQISAQAFANAEAEHSRKFATWQVWTGTVKSPGKPVGPVIRGTK